MSTARITYSAQHSKVWKLTCEDPTLPQGALAVSCLQPPCASSRPFLGVRLLKGELGTAGGHKDGGTEAAASRLVRGQDSCRRRAASSKAQVQNHKTEGDLGGGCKTWDGT